MKARTGHLALLIAAGMSLWACQSTAGCIGMRKDLPQAGPARTLEEIAWCVKEEKRRLIQDLTPIELASKPVSLRSDPVDLPDDGCEKAIAKWNFTRHESESGCFVNVFLEITQFREAEIDEPPEVVTDLATGLVWADVSIGQVSFKSVDESLQNANQNKRGGYSDWRLPTTEELLSILNIYGENHLDAWLFDQGRDWWTSDRKLGGKMRWTVDARYIKCVAEDVQDESVKHLVYATRAMSKQEWKEARAKYEKWKASQESKGREE